MTKILLFGDACVDVYHYGSIDRLCPEAPVPVLNHVRTEKRDGMCLNVRNNLRAFGVDVTAIYNVETIEKQRFVDLRTKQHLLRADFGENVKLPPCTAPTIEGIDFNNFDGVVLADYDKGFLVPENIELILKKASSAGIDVYVDSKKSDLSCYEGCIIKINKLEFEKTKKFPKNHELIVTVGKLGARWRETTYSTEECDVFDVCGAGDTFLASFVYEKIITDSIEQGIIFANKCSRLVVGKFGTYNLTPEDVKGLRKNGN